MTQKKLKLTSAKIVITKETLIFTYDDKDPEFMVLGNSATTLASQDNIHKMFKELKQFRKKSVC